MFVIQTIHQIPINDLKSHIEDGVYCHCFPLIIKNNANSLDVIHNAYDGREFALAEHLGYPRFAYQPVVDIADFDGH